jgi:hypothetical protein
MRRKNCPPPGPVLVGSARRTPTRRESGHPLPRNLPRAGRLSGGWGTLAPTVRSRPAATGPQPYPSRHVLIETLARNPNNNPTTVHPAKAHEGVERSGHADSNWSCVQGLQIRSSGLHVDTIRRGREELAASLEDRPSDRVRLPGGGRPALEKKPPRSSQLS